MKTGNLCAVLLVPALLAVSGCRMHDFRTVVVNAPGATEHSCTDAIAKSIASMAEVPDTPEITSFNNIVTYTYGTFSGSPDDTLENAPSPDAATGWNAFPPKKKAVTNKVRWEQRNLAIQQIVFNLGKGTITVVYDSMKTAVKNIEYAVAAAGYDVKTIPYDIPGQKKAK